MKKHKINHKLIIAIVIILILLVLVIFTRGITKLNDKDKIKLAENSENELISNEPNSPQLSSGMIPVKFDGAKWIITTTNDKEWYDYKNGKPAYIMLNDGYYQSQLIRDMTGKELAENNVGVGVPDDPSKRGTIFMWIPRFVYKESGEIGYIKEETTLGEGWILPDSFMYKITDNTKPDFSLSGVWVEKDVDTNYANKITQMNREESIYGFIANTKPKQITSNDINELQKIVGTDDNSSEDITQNVGASIARPQINDITNQNRIILQIINDKKHEPIKANIIQNKDEQRLEIRVTYTSNGIKEILDEYGNKMTLTEENGIIYTDTGTHTIGIGTYKFTVIDNNGNKKELTITPTINSLFKVAYINGTDNMDNSAAYNIVATQSDALTQISAMNTDKTYKTAIVDSNKFVTALEERNRNASDESLYVYEKNKVNNNFTVSKSSSSSSWREYKVVGVYGYSSYSIDQETGNVTLKSGSIDSGYSYSSSHSAFGSRPSGTYTIKYPNKFYYHTSSVSYDKDRRYYYTSGSVYTMTIKQGTPKKGSRILNSDRVAKEGEIQCDCKWTDGYWYEQGGIAPKYTLQKYDQNLKLQSTYDVDSKTMWTEKIDISKKDITKLKLKIYIGGANYKVYISNDNTNWQEVADITSNTLKELNVDGWDNLYIKIDTQPDIKISASILYNIDVAFYKD